MNNFKKEYNDFFNCIVVNESLKNQIINKTINNKKKTISIFTAKRVFLTFFIILTVCIIYKNEIVNAIKSLYIINTKENNTSTCIIPNPVIEVNNKKAYDELFNKKAIDIKQLENILNIKILNHNLLENEIVDYDIKEEKGQLSYMNIRRNSINVKELYNTGYDSSKIEVNISFLTTNAPNELQEAKSAFDDVYLEKRFNSYNSNIFEAKNCNSNNFDIYFIREHNTNLYIFKYNFENNWYPYIDEEKKLEKDIFAFFEYNNILYSIKGEYISRDMLVDFIQHMN